ncbi:MAG TPA: D-alanine--D-alanine ligase [Firmicutes bacterium]|jgi:D-alanine-D-alanine ligase|nr:D-alanine--D-alanine ligase [Bacillota bacterium]
MKIGLTYDLKDDYLKMGFSDEAAAEFDSMETIIGIEEALKSLDYQTEKIGNIQSLTQQLAAGKRWDLVFNICEGLYGLGREAQVPCLLDAYQIPYTFSDPLVLALALNKELTKRVIRDLKIATPDFAVIEDEKDIDQISMEFPLFLKPIAEGTGKGISKNSTVSNREELLTTAKKILLQFQQPVLVETYLPGREFTVGILGTGDAARVIGVMEITLKTTAEPGSYSYLNKKHYRELVEYSFPNDLESRLSAELALKAWKGLGCRDGGRIDVRSDRYGKPHFIEVNPLAGLHPDDSDLPIICKKAGLTYQELIKIIVDSAKIRVGLMG